MSKRKNSDGSIRMVTNIKTSSFKFEWQIDDFEKIFDTKTQISSEIFFSKENPSFRWYFSAQIIVDEDCGANTLAGTKKFISVFLHSDSPNKSFVKLILTISILNSERQKCYDKNLIDDAPAGSKSYGFEKFISLDNMKHSKNIFMPNKTLIILAEIDLIYFVNILKEPKHKCMEDGQENYCGHNKYLDLSPWYNNSDFTDLTLICDDVKILVHKVILAANSVKFAKKFKNLEDTELRLPVSLPVMQELLSFMYRGYCPKIEQYYNELYVTAIQMKMPNLKDLIEKYLSTTVNLENAFNLLLWAQTSNAENLKANIKLFIVQNIQEIVKNDEFQKFIRDHAKLTNELFCGVVENYVRGQADT